MDKKQFKTAIIDKIAIGVLCLVFLGACTVEPLLAVMTVAAVLLIKKHKH